MQESMINFDNSLMYVTDDRISDDNKFFSILENALDGGVTVVQLREKSVNSRMFFKRALKAKDYCYKYNVPLIINDRLDIAISVDADGVHLGQQDLHYNLARKILGKEKIIGVSVSNKKQLLEVNDSNVNYVGFSPVFSTNTKVDDLEQPLGLEGLKSLSVFSKKPIVSIGGINKENLKGVLNFGSSGVAVISAISKSQNPFLATTELKKILIDTEVKNLTPNSNEEQI